MHIRAAAINRIITFITPLGYGQNEILEGRNVELWETLIDICNDWPAFKATTTNWLINKNKHKQPQMQISFVRNPSDCHKIYKKGHFAQSAVAVKNMWNVWPRYVRTVCAPLFKDAALSKALCLWKKNPSLCPRAPTDKNTDIGRIQMQLIKINIWGSQRL